VELVCLALARERFTEILGPLQDIMTRDKSPQVGLLQRHHCMQGSAIPTGKVMSCEGNDVRSNRRGWGYGSADMH